VSWWTTNPAGAKTLAVAIFAARGIYQLTPIKDRCLARCRSPRGFIFKYGSYRARLRELRVGMSHGAFCLGCCWALVAVLVAVVFRPSPASGLYQAPEMSGGGMTDSSMGVP
jgi:predicted metal-binding membrane protein